MAYRELPHNTQEQIIDYIRDALAAIEAADVPEHLEAIAFTKALDWRAAKSIEVTQPGPPILGRVG